MLEYVRTFILAEYINQVIRDLDISNKYQTYKD